jgi:hypothetical protein
VREPLRRDLELSAGQNGLPYRRPMQQRMDGRAAWGGVPCCRHLCMDCLNCRPVTSPRAWAGLEIGRVVAFADGGLWISRRSSPAEGARSRSRCSTLVDATYRRCRRERRSFGTLASCAWPAVREDGCDQAMEGGGGPKSMREAVTTSLGDGKNGRCAGRRAGCASAGRAC